ncbi:Glycosyltransferase 1 domain-containing protein isoform 3 [Schistosoma japonicum]|uniref:Glycosyltransferase 1 domain-containing protein isoform 3 n=1 Tax=Schistosoma japonicum TaxID=6182 RepID=A0A4Z2DTU8_SCHJA|nr:Glycosyltransferase 1 domain-containing protein isoform 3 [Schistosoma japonicum]
MKQSMQYTNLRHFVTLITNYLWKLLQVKRNITSPDYSGQLQVIHQAINVDVEHANHYKKDVLEAVESKLGVKLQPFFIVVGLLRDVKDPMFALKAFLDWRNQDGNTYSKTASPINYKSYNLLYVGSVEEDTENIQQFIDEVDGKAVHRCDTLTQKELHSLMLSSEALINCSVSEGQSLAVMEAMFLGIPVVVRENPGNCDLVKDRENGLVFKTPQEMGECLTHLEGNPEIKRQLISAGEEFIDGKEFQREHQAKLYSHIIQKCLLHGV